MDHMWMVYSLMSNQILQAKSIRMKLYYGKIVIVSALFLYGIQVSGDEIFVKSSVFLAPGIALLFDFHIRARDKAIQRDSAYVAKYLEPLLDEICDPDSLFQKKMSTLDEDESHNNRFLFPQAYYRYIPALEWSSNRRLERYSHFLFTIVMFIASIAVVNHRFPL